MATHPLRSEKLDLRLSPLAKQTLYRAAAAVHRSVSDFVLELSLIHISTGQANSTSYFMKLGNWPEFDLIRPAGANRLMGGFRNCPNH